MLEILFYIAVYILTVVSWLLIYAYINRKRCYTIGDVFDCMEFEFFIPILNTFLLIFVGLYFIFYSIGRFIWKKLKLNKYKLWEKIRNIKIKK